MYKGLLIVISGPSGAGKGTIYGKVLEKLPEIKKSVSVTTRQPRQGEIDGVHYHFKTEEQYNRMIANGEFLETAAVYKNYYGTPKAPVFEMLEAGNDVMFEIDNYGSRQIKAKYPDAVTIYVMTPSFAELKRRLTARGTESEEKIAKRLERYDYEVSKKAEYDYVVVNDDLRTAVASIRGIIKSLK